MAALRTVIQLRISPQEKADIEWAARQRNEKVSEFLRRLAKEDADLLRAEQGEQVERIAQQESLLSAAYPQGEKKCTHVAKGQFCYICNRTRW